MHAYVVNLARSPDRRAHISAQLARTGIQYEVVPAVDGRELDLGNTELFDPALIRRSGFRPGAAGCALSHLEVYRRVLADGRDQALVLEDDVNLPADLAIVADAVAAEMSATEVVLLNFHSIEPCRITNAGSVRLPSSRRLVHLVDEAQASSTGAYMITREACRRMLQTCLPLRSQPDDWALFHQEGSIDVLRCVVPMVVTNALKFRTTIDYYHPGSMQARVREAVASAKVPIIYQALALRRRRTFQRAGWTGQTELIAGPGLTMLSPAPAKSADGGR
ncbi:MAG TPA: glycosyltransferase family 25 protein [Streptosporangiaceae bacterium]|jgi:glycosyl transferase family 25